LNLGASVAPKSIQSHPSAAQSSLEMQEMYIVVRDALLSRSPSMMADLRLFSVLGCRYRCRNVVSRVKIGFILENLSLTAYGVSVVE
jgi:hypothetical protein